MVPFGAASHGFDVILKVTERKSLGRPRRIWEDNIIMNLKEIGVITRNWVDFAQEYCRALVKVILNIRIP